MVGCVGGGSLNGVWLGGSWVYVHMDERVCSMDRCGAVGECCVCEDVYMVGWGWAAGVWGAYGAVWRIDGILGGCVGDGYVGNGYVWVINSRVCDWVVRRRLE